MTHLPCACSWHITVDVKVSIDEDRQFGLHVSVSTPEVGGSARVDSLLCFCFNDDRVLLK